MVRSAEGFRRVVAVRADEVDVSVAGEVVRVPVPVGGASAGCGERVSGIRIPHPAHVGRPGGAKPVDDPAPCIDVELRARWRCRSRHPATRSSSCRSSPTPARRARAPERLQSVRRAIDGRVGVAARDGRQQSPGPAPGPVEIERDVVRRAGRCNCTQHPPCPPRLGQRRVEVMECLDESRTLSRRLRELRQRREDALGSALGFPENTPPQNGTVRFSGRAGSTPTIRALPWARTDRPSTRREPRAKGLWSMERRNDWSWRRRETLCWPGWLAWLP